MSSEGSSPPTNTAQQGGNLDPRVCFAAERTLLAWVRTGLAMMGFGFVVARFGLFLRELTKVTNEAADRHSTLSLWVGTALIAIGVGVNIGAAVKHWSTVRRLEEDRPLRLNRWSLGVIVAYTLGIFGLLMACYLVFGLDRAK
jgi:putative membrane protein